MSFVNRLTTYNRPVGAVSTNVQIARETTYSHAWEESQNHPSSLYALVHETYMLKRLGLCNYDCII